METEGWNEEQGMESMDQEVRSGRCKIKGREDVEPMLGNRRSRTEGMPQKGMEWMTICSILQRKLTMRYNIPHTLVYIVTRFWYQE